MYLDNVIKSAQAASMPEITYSEIVEDSLRMVEVEGAGQMALLKAEATAHIMGSEAPSDWWAKIKTVARKIFEMLKNLITKVFAFVKTIPTKIGTLITRLLTKWEKLGMKAKIEKLNKKSGQTLRKAVAQDLSDREFPRTLSVSVGSNGFTNTPSAAGKIMIGADAVNQISRKIAEIVRSGLQHEDNDRLEEEKQALKELETAGENAVKDAKEFIDQHPLKPFSFLKSYVDGQPMPSNFLGFINSGWGLLKNKNIEKNASQFASNVEKGIRDFASAYRMAMSAYERLVKDEDEDGVRACLETAKMLRSTISWSASYSSKGSSYIYKDALTVARILNAALSAVKGGQAVNGQGQPVGNYPNGQQRP
jgi:hypothetical protein